MFPRYLDPGSVAAPPQIWRARWYGGWRGANGGCSSVARGQCCETEKVTYAVEGGWKAAEKTSAKVHAKCNQFLVRQHPCCLHLLFHRHRRHCCHVCVGSQCLASQPVDRYLFDVQDMPGLHDEKMLLECFLAPCCPQVEESREDPHSYSPRYPLRPAADGCDVKISAWAGSRCWGKN